jgi:hypothetical protein
VSSARKSAANRTNARGSTGPKTAQGRTRAARNALRHGLNVPIYSDPTMSEDFDLRRVRLARHHHLVDALRTDAQTDVASSGKLALTASQMKKLLAMDRYEACARLRLKSAIEVFDKARNSPD